MSESDAPKIIVDDDWKSQAQAEKQKLAAADRDAAEKRAATKQQQEDGDHGFDALLGTLVTQALLYMGAFPGPDGRAVVSLEHAKLYIDLLPVLQEKTQGNLTDAEAEDLQKATTELRTQFVEITKAVAQMQADGTAQPMGGPAGPGPTPGPGMTPPGMNPPGF